MPKDCDHISIVCGGGVGKLPEQGSRAIDPEPEMCRYYDSYKTIYVREKPGGKTGAFLKNKRGVFRVSASHV